MIYVINLILLRLVFVFFLLVISNFRENCKYLFKCWYKVELDILKRVVVYKEWYCFGMERFIF